MRNTQKIVLSHSETLDESSKDVGCTYCGYTCDITRDHVIPVSWKTAGRHYQRGDTISACRECNSTLSDVGIFAVPERASYLLSKYLVKYRKHLAMPRWEDWELDELDQSLRGKVEASVFESEICRLRIDHLIQISSDCEDIFRAKYIPKDSPLAIKIITSLISGVTIDEVKNIYQLKTKEIKKFTNSKLYSSERYDLLHKFDMPLDTDVYALARALELKGRSR